jgi:hypothetical protein
MPGLEVLDRGPRQRTVNPVDDEVMERQHGVEPHLRGGDEPAGVAVPEHDMVRATGEGIIRPGIDLARGRGLSPGVGDRRRGRHHRPGSERGADRDRGALPAAPATAVDLGNPPAMARSLQRAIPQFDDPKITRVIQTQRDIRAYR